MFKLCCVSPAFLENFSPCLGMEKNVWPLHKMDNVELLSQCVRKDKPKPLCGIYLLIKGDRIIYIGQSIDVEQRIKDHARPKSGLVPHFDYYLMFPCEKIDLNRYERLFIERFFPVHNNDGATVSQKVKIITARLKIKQDKDKQEQFINDALNQVPFENRVKLIKQIEHRFFEDLCILKTQVI